MIPLERIAIAQLAIAQLAIYIFLFPFTIPIIIRHTFRQHGWVYLSIFCALRIASSSLTILSTKHPQDRSDAAWAATLGSIGLSPLTLASIGIVSRLLNYTSSFPAKRILLVLGQVLCYIGLVIAIVGGTKLSSNDASKVSNGYDYAKAGIILFVAAYGCLLLLIAASVASRRQLPTVEHKLIYTLIVALPFIFIRLIYSILIIFVNNKTFAIKGGSPWAQLGMEIIEEMVVIIVYIAAGYSVPGYREYEAGMQGRGIGGRTVTGRNGADMYASKPVVV